ncbi:alpha/beta fold hydrolase [Cohnella sp. JJ-181]|uniref:alpha/beta fold hydrolase n=1 Tax=Cohnella rhizoplanae TaxID=2974897 RepID=UPI0022FFA146|nr:alpha/beta fold hydrolase [Cohnella sp. JJ-181]CAI6080373.1 2-succinyl-6-hydroxy-2, 4-cyclohexadiene-1-carboxylate synthase [Cohnella sp. JJ-181]
MARNRLTLNNGLEVSCMEEGQGVPLLLLHGYCGSGGYWTDVLPLLSAHARVIAPDARGHGETAATEGTYAMELLAEDALQLLDALNIRQAFVLGHSMGGYAALALAERAPDRLLGLGLLHSTTYPDDDNGKANRDKVAERIASEGMRGHIADLVPKLFSPDNLEPMKAQVDRALAIGFDTSAAGGIGAALGMKARPDRRGVLESLEAPILLLAGESDRVIGPDKRFPVAGPNITHRLLEGAGHMGMMERPDAFAEAILDFVRQAEEREGGGADV